MEISIDLAYVRGILRQEHKQARAEIQSEGALRALENSQQRHDARIASAPDVGTLACRAGCTWCCHFSVDVRAVEVFSILDFVERTFTIDEKARVYAEVRGNSATLKNLDEIERMQRNVKCPFLNDGRCTIYSVRPQTCRNYHATNVAGCQQSYEDPNNLDIDPDFAPWVYQAGGAHVEAFSNAMRDAGYDVSAYELNSALATAMTELAARERFESKQPPFADLSGEEAPAEFDDLDPE
ncbi:MAG TPA: YkgJ family cysteine cluster protein [Steroidobacteraceae bacterium]|jgi:Fe-S-cluster containining protein